MFHFTCVFGFIIYSKFATASDWIRTRHMIQNILAYFIQNRHWKSDVHCAVKNFCDIHRSVIFFPDISWLHGVRSGALCLQSLEGSDQVIGIQGRYNDTHTLCNTSRSTKSRLEMARAFLYKFVTVLLLPRILFMFSRLLVYILKQKNDDTEYRIKIQNNVTR